MLSVFSMSNILENPSIDISCSGRANVLYSPNQLICYKFPLPWYLEIEGFRSL